MRNLAPSKVLVNIRWGLETESGILDDAVFNQSEVAVVRKSPLRLAAITIVWTVALETNDMEPNPGPPLYTQTEIGVFEISQ